MKQHFNCVFVLVVKILATLSLLIHMQSIAFVDAKTMHFCIMSWRKSLILPRRALVNKHLPGTVAYIELLKKLLKCWWDGNGETHTQWIFDLKGMRWEIDPFVLRTLIYWSRALLLFTEHRFNTNENEYLLFTLLLAPSFYYSLFRLECRGQVCGAFVVRLHFNKTHITSLKGFHSILSLDNTRQKSLRCAWEVRICSFRIIPRKRNIIVIRFGSVWWVKFTSTPTPWLRVNLRNLEDASEFKPIKVSVVCLAY